MSDTTADTALVPPHAPELRALGGGQVDGLAAMVLELAAQLHVERARVRALEYHLRALAPIGDGPLTLPAEAAGPRAELAADLNRSVAALLAATVERDDTRAPLRDEMRTGGED
jgi:hypothetical protein